MKLRILRGVLLGGVVAGFASCTSPWVEPAQPERAADAAKDAGGTESGGAESGGEKSGGAESPKAQKRASLLAFAQVASVLRHPRCLNCHPSGDRPHVGDERRLHGMNVQRGPDNHGAAGLHCEACHRTENQAGPKIPGAPHWQLAPRSMGWEGLDDHDLAERLIDKTRNGNRSFDDLVHHMENDPLILWAWKPGEGRAVPPLSHEEFIRELKKWFATGAQIPHRGETTF